MNIVIDSRSFTFLKYLVQVATVIIINDDNFKIIKVTNIANTCHYFHHHVQLSQRMIWRCSYLGNMLCHDCSRSCHDIWGCNHRSSMVVDSYRRLENLYIIFKVGLFIINLKMSYVGPKINIYYNLEYKWQLLEKKMKSFWDSKGCSENWSVKIKLLTGETDV